MNRPTAFALRVARRAVRAVSPPPHGPPEPEALLAGQAASDHIRGRLEDGRPLLVARLGATELDCLLMHLSRLEPGSTVRKSLEFVAYRRAPFWWFEPAVRRMALWSGFFPAAPEHLERFSELMLADLPEIDVLGSWLAGERVVADRLAGAVRVRLRRPRAVRAR